MSRFRPYVDYVDCDIEWMTQAPAHWTISRVQDIGKIMNGHPFDAKLFNSDGKYPLVRIRDLNSECTATRYDGEFIASAAIDSSDVLIGMDGDFNVGQWRGNGKALLNQRMCCVRTEDPNLTSFLAYLLPTPLKVINDTTYSTTVKHLSSSDVQKIKLALPPKDELNQVLKLLDREITRIDTLIAKKTRFIELLKEKRQAVITKAVTKGLDPDVKLNDSGVDWIGSIPAGWKVAPIKYVAKLESGHTPSRSVPAYWENCTVPWFTLADIWQVRKAGRSVITETSEMVSELGLANSSARKLPAGTVVLSRTASVGFPAILASEMATSQDFAAWICRDGLHNEYLYFCLVAMRSELGRLMMGSTHKTIYMPDIEQLRCPLPPIDEQKVIASRLWKQTERVGSLVAKTERSIELLKERRAALITAAVTGKIDVREAA